MTFTRNEIMLPEQVALCERVYQKVIDIKKIEVASDAREPLAALIMALFRHGITEEGLLYERVLEDLEAE